MDKVMAKDKTELVKGTLEMLILRVLTRGEMHGWASRRKFSNGRVRC